MIPAGLTIAAILADAATVVAQFDTLIVLVAGLAAGIFVVRFLIGKVKSSMR